MILPYDVRTNIVWSDMQTAAALMDSVASGRKPMQMIGSVSGFGKTTIAKKRFRHYGIVSEEELYRSLPALPEISATSFPGLPPAMLKSRPQTRQTAVRRAVLDMPPFENAKRRLFIESRPTSPISLVRTLRLCSQLQASALLFDDPGRIARDEAACDILKTAFGMQRTVTFETPQITINESWRISGHGGYDPFVPPPYFPVPADLRWLWLANTNYTDPAVLAKLGDHFAPLIARGLNPFWIRDDAEHDNHDLFLYVYHLATEENLLRSMGFPYEVSRKAVNFYVTHANRLVDLCPRRLELIAKAFAADQPPAALAIRYRDPRRRQFELRTDRSARRSPRSKGSRRAAFADASENTSVFTVSHLRLRRPTILIQGHHHLPPVNQSSQTRNQIRGRRQSSIHHQTLF